MYHKESQYLPAAADTGRHITESDSKTLVQTFAELHGATPVQRILDLGCSVGVSSRLFANRYPNAEVTGLDLSPHFLAVAEHRERSALDALGPVSAIIQA